MQASFFLVGGKPQVIKAFPANVIQKSTPGKQIFITSGTGSPRTENAAASGNASATPRQVVIVGSSGEFVHLFLLFGLSTFPPTCLFTNFSLA